MEGFGAMCCIFGWQALEITSILLANGTLKGLLRGSRNDSGQFLSVNNSKETRDVEATAESSVEEDAGLHIVEARQPHEQDNRDENNKGNEELVDSCNGDNDLPDACHILQVLSKYQCY